jgi:Leucine-rich repeat (LRR) protein
LGEYLKETNIFMSAEFEKILKLIENDDEQNFQLGLLLAEGYPKEFEEYFLCTLDKYKEILSFLKEKNALYKLNETSYKELDLQWRQLTTLPPTIKYLGRTEKLILEENYHLETLPEEIKELKNLKELELSRCDLKKIPTQVMSILSIEVLICWENEITHLPHQISKLKNLRELNLSKNKLKNIPLSIGKLSNLRKLSIFDNKIKKIPETIGNMKSLEEIDLYSNKIKVIPKEIWKLSNLKEFSLGSNQIQEISKEIMTLKKLERLSLSENKIKEIPKEIGELESLGELYLDDNEIEELPVEIANLKNLKRLNIKRNRIKLIPKEIRNMIHSQRLRIEADGRLVTKEKLMSNGFEECLLLMQSGDKDKIQEGLERVKNYQPEFENYFDSFFDEGLELIHFMLKGKPWSFDIELKEIKFLRKSGLRNSDFPKSLEKFKNLERLELRNCKASILSASIFDAENLEFIDAWSNKFKTIPFGISKLKKLETLYLSNNKIRKIPKELGQMISLKSLSLSNNQIKKLPKELSLLENLEYLDVRDNLLKTLPPELKKLEKCKIHISGNPDLVLPKEFIGWENIIL